ncbi:MAG: N-formylglutamate amidohydrolase [Hyphomicrobiales bacterium]|nr:MAG: N-formylglutamate amidohydrolase [Hyphomicrobiales bacterium]
MTTGFETPSNPPFEVYGPAVQRVPFVLNSPHSGRNYTSAFMSNVQLSDFAIRKSEDFLVDELFGSGVAIGLPMLVANFPRAFLDVNREPYELDPKMFDSQLPDYVNTQSVRVSTGLGTIAKIVADREEIYHGPISLNDALERIEDIYKPYHACLRRLLAQTHVRFGYAVLIDCHSMPSAHHGSPYGLRPDFVIGDRFGSSCSEELTLCLRDNLKALGYKVVLNKPYAGGFITQHYGRPDNGLHAVQIEINRGLYMDENSMQKSENFEKLADDIRQLLNIVVSMPEAAMLGNRPLAAE